MLGFDEIWMIPCGSRPDKPQISPAHHRLKMVKMSVKEFFPPGFPIHVDATEVEHGDSIPTVILLDQLKEKY